VVLPWEKFLGKKDEVKEINMPILLHQDNPENLEVKGVLTFKRQEGMGLVVQTCGPNN
jgi:hypothetical protein